MKACTAVTLLLSLIKGANTMFRYAEIDENGIVFAVSYMEEEIDKPTLILISDDFDITNKKYINGEWIEYIPEPVPEPPLSEMEQSILETAINTDYLVCLADLGV